MRDKYWRMRAYSPYFDSRTAWYSRAWSYKDAMAIYPGENLLVDSTCATPRAASSTSGYDCGGGSCPQFAGDIGSPAFRAHWIADAKRMYQAGYQGLFVDDVNMELRISDGNGNLQWPVDPRTGAAMNEASWRRYMAEFMEQIRREIPGAEIVHNSLWFNGDERPVHPPRPGRRRPDRDRARHQRRRPARRRGRRVPAHAVQARSTACRRAARASSSTRARRPPPSRMYGLAGYFLISNGRDALGNNPAGTPEDWWAGYDTDLGEALGPRFDLPNGVIRRDFTAGTVLLNTPDEPSGPSPWAPGYKDLERRRAHLGDARPGARASCCCAPARRVAPADRDDGRPGRPMAPVAAGLDVREARPARRRRVSRVGRKVRVTGRVDGATPAVRLVVQRKTGRKWKTVRRSPACRDGSFSTTIKASAGAPRAGALRRDSTSRASVSSLPHVDGVANGRRDRQEGRRERCAIRRVRHDDHGRLAGRSPRFVSGPAIAERLSIGAGRPSSSIDARCYRFTASRR